MNVTLNQRTSPQQQQTYSPSPWKRVGAVALIATGIILIIGCGVAAGASYPYLGLASFKFLPSALFGIPLILIGIDQNNRCRSNRNSAILPVDKKDPSELKIISIGNASEPLNEEGIRERLSNLEDRENIDVLVIYGDGNVELNVDPGFVDMNPKKVVLIGAKIIRNVTERAKLDDTLFNDGRWSMQRPDESERHQAWTQQKRVGSLDEAIAHTPPDSPTGTKYHLVYRVIN